jgi:hypothetical protein
MSCFVLCSIAAGCGAQKSFDVSVKNQTTQPVTLWLTKDGPPAENGWLSPEQLAKIPQDSKPKYDLAIVPPGKTGYTGKLSGEFPEGTRAVLRVYPGALELFHIAEAIKSGGVKHVDATLKPGGNKLAVVERDGQIAVEPAR